MKDHDAFFVGYLKAPRQHAIACLTAAMLCLAGLIALALALGRSPIRPDDSGYAGEVALQGSITPDPYPLLLLPADPTHPAGRAIMLAGDGKRGVQAMAADLKGRTVMARGVMLKRGDLDMLVVAGDNGLQAIGANTYTSAEPVSLGRWRMAGEICDGKCYSGAMHPGAGVSHKACANLCIGGGVPPVFAAFTPVENASFFLLADANGKSAPARLFDLVGIPVWLEGEMHRIGDLVVFRADWKTAAAQ